MRLKQCTQCGRALPLKEFRYYKGYYQSPCHECLLKMQRAKYRRMVINGGSRLAHYRQYQREYREKRREKKDEEE